MEAAPRTAVLWFTTSRGLAVFDPKARKRTRYTPVVHLVDMTADGNPVDLSTAARLQPAAGRVQFRYTGDPLERPRTRALFVPFGWARSRLGAGRLAPRD